jgi:4'-phosphopantetheinyl transferase
MTEIWAVQLQHSLTPEQARLAKTVLPPERRERMDRSKHGEEPLCAYVALQVALWKTAGLRKMPKISISQGGKPFFPENPEICFNLSHTGGAVLAGVSTLELGVDIEKIRPMKPAVMQRLSHETRLDDFFQNWVRREAVAKRDGSGFRSLMKSEIPEDAFYRAFEPFPGYAAGAAMRESAAFVLHCCTAQELLEELAEIL